MCVYSAIGGFGSVAGVVHTPSVNHGIHQYFVRLVFDVAFFAIVSIILLKGGPGMAECMCVSVCVWICWCVCTYLYAGAGVSLV